MVLIKILNGYCWLYVVPGNLSRQTSGVWSQFSYTSRHYDLFQRITSYFHKSNKTLKMSYILTSKIHEVHSNRCRKFFDLLIIKYTIVFGNIETDKKKSINFKKYIYIQSAKHVLNILSYSFTPFLFLLSQRP